MSSNVVVMSVCTRCLIFCSTLQIKIRFRCLLSSTTSPLRILSWGRWKKNNRTNRLSNKKRPNIRGCLTGTLKLYTLLEELSKVQNKDQCKGQLNHESHRPLMRSKLQRAGKVQKFKEEKTIFIQHFSVWYSIATELLSRTAYETCLIKFDVIRNIKYSWKKP